MDSSRDPLDDDLRDLLATYRAAVQPPAASELRIRGSLQASVPDWSTPPRPADAGVLLSLGSRGRQAVFLLCSAAAALALTLGLSSYLGEHRQRAEDNQQSPFQRRDAEPSTSAVVTSADPRRGSERPSPASAGAEGERLSVDGGPALATPEGSESSEEPTKGGAPISTETPERAPRAHRTTPSRRPAREDRETPLAEPAADATEAATQAPSALDLAEELRLIRKAEEHLRAGRDAQAIEVLDRHRQDFPKGQLEPEREASRVSALCLQGREREASAQAQVFAERWPHSPLLPRVRRVCATLSSEQ